MVLHMAMTGKISLLGPGPPWCPARYPCEWANDGCSHGSMVLIVSQRNNHKTHAL